MAAVALAPRAAWAHPLAQGAVDVAPRAGAIALEITVPLEEVSIEAAATGLALARAEQLRHHGEYLLRHFVVSVDGRRVAGRLVATSTATSGRPVYRLEYATEGPVRELVLRQDVLREIEFAPGNPWESTYAVAVRIDGRVVRDGLLLASAAPLAVDAAGDGHRSRFGAYVRLGVAHILGGWDHLLFVLALVLASRGLVDVLKAISVFTLAHTVTLTLAALDLVRLPPAVVEPVIAASIIAVALRSVVATHAPPRLLVVFAFGLFHGLGFAGGLRDALAAESTGAVAAAIAGFSVGVELGHQFVIAPGLLLLEAPRRLQTQRRDLRASLVRWGSACISAAGVVYLVAALTSCTVGRP